MPNEANFGSPSVVLGQGDADVIYNKLRNLIGALLGGSVKNRTTTAPPAAIEGDRYLIAATATGLWTSKEKQIAAWQDGAWQYYSPKTGNTIWLEDEKIFLVYIGGTWTSVPGEAIFAGAYTTGSQAVDGTNRWVPWDTEYRKDAGVFSHSTSSNKDEITVLEAGDYLIEADVTFNHTAGATDSRVDVAVTVAGSDLTYSLARAVGNSGNDNQQTVRVQAYVAAVAANSIIKVKATRGAGTGTISLLANGSRITIRRV